MRIRSTLLVFFIALLFALPAPAQRKRGPGKPTPPRAEAQCRDFTGDELEACKILGAYLDQWKEQKWGQVRKLIHPMTLERIATAKKNIGEERHAMAPWYWAKEVYLLHDWEIESIRENYAGTIEVNTVETTYRVEEDGFEEGGAASYLVGKKDGKWYVVDRRSGGGGFTEDSIRLGMKGFFDEPAKPADAQAKPAKEGKKAKPAIQLNPREELELSTE